MTCTRLLYLLNPRSFRTSIMKTYLTLNRSCHGFVTIPVLYSSVTVRDSHPTSYAIFSQLHKILMISSKNILQLYEAKVNIWG